ncbi:hypothetical protein [Aliivibrio fischeri]|uniref:hypothetical protein n=1 Tax=Aliivibrio fischeri TaxID=668 RepID=UPI0007C51DAA|nr:hypothetical protein [Aliivibrio fischeri]TDM54651.1 hypothetical protein VFFQA001_08875 [Aliivibrio fischeri]
MEKVWNEELGCFSDNTEKKVAKIVNAYFPWNEELAKESKPDIPYYEPVKEPQPKVAAFEYSIEIACSQDELNTYQVGVFSLGKTKEEETISSWSKVQTDDGFTLLTASVNVNEPKKLHREFFSLSGSAISFDDVKPVKKGSGSHSESFVPIKPAVQVDKRLGWPTEGYFYHFIDDSLIHEYKLMGDGKWAFQVTQSNEHHLTDELVSQHQYSFILLPWKINNKIIARQHLLYLPQKMTTKQLEELTPDWIDENGCLLDVNEIAEARAEKVLERESDVDEKGTLLLPPVDVTKEKTVFSWANLWINEQSSTIHPVVATLHKMDSIPKNTPVINVRAKKHGINPKNMYWPAYDFTKEGDDKYFDEVEYVDDITTLAALSKAEFDEFFTAVSHTIAVKDFVVGLYPTVKDKLNFLINNTKMTGVIRVVDGQESVILNHIKAYFPILEQGTLFSSSNPQVIKWALGSTAIKGASKFLTLSAPTEIIVGSAVNVVNYMVNDEMTLRELKIAQWQIVVRLITSASVVFAAGIIAPYLVTSAAIGVTFTLVSMSIYALDNAKPDPYDQGETFSKDFIEHYIPEELLSD